MFIASQIRNGTQTFANNNQLKQTGLDLSMRDVIVMDPNPADFIKIESSKKVQLILFCKMHLGKKY
ncbi:MAG: hypothetical protein IPL09_11515 [Bacteroidetes bacterium]|nr:hypothetical protein [Bacteroidota bacterium]